MNGKAGMVLAFMLAAVIGVIFLQPVVGAANDNSGTQTVTNETIDANYDTFVDLGGYAVVSGSETVWGYNDTDSSYETAVQGTDYELNLNSGEIKILNGSSLIEDGETVKVSYDYEASGELTATVMEFIPVMLGTLVLVIVARGVQREM
jgi:hypothetical protein